MGIKARVHGARDSIDGPQDHVRVLAVPLGRSSSCHTASGILQGCISHSTDGNPVCDGWCASGTSDLGSIYARSTKGMNAADLFAEEGESDSQSLSSPCSAAACWSPKEFGLLDGLDLACFRSPANRLGEGESVSNGNGLLDRYLEVSSNQVLDNVVGGSCNLDPYICGVATALNRHVVHEDSEADGGTDDIGVV